MNYEEYLLACRASQSEPNAELERVASLKTLVHQHVNFET
jgi:hypothetical protein